MSSASSTCWSMIDAAAAGDAEQRARFVERYGPVVRASLLARRGRPLSAADLDDRVQETFLECFRAGGALGRVEAGRPGGFRGYLYGVVRNVALRGEQRRRREDGGLALPADMLAAADPDAESAFERAWAKAVMREAAVEMDRRAASRSPAAKRRVELLHLRFHEDLPIREIARRWAVDAANLHHEYADARREFLVALRSVVAAESESQGPEIEAECVRLLSLLG